MANEYINKDGHEYVRENNSFETLRDDWFFLIEPEFNAADQLLSFKDVPFNGNEEAYWTACYNNRNEWIMGELRKAGKIFTCEEDEDYIYVLND